VGSKHFKIEKNFIAHRPISLELCDFFHVKKQSQKTSPRIYSRGGQENMVKSRPHSKIDAIISEN
jgi:hypothetical protein